VNPVLGDYHTILHAIALYDVIAAKTGGFCPLHQSIIFDDLPSDAIPLTGRIAAI
jgi:hypothetical protein